MIYCFPPDKYPQEGQYIEELVYMDENSIEWRIARVKNGFIVKYFGDEYFKDKSISCELESGRVITIRNTGCIFVNDDDFETFCLVRDIIKTGFTDDIWETFEEMFTERFEHDKGILECEMI